MELNPSRKVIIYLLFALSGFCALVYEVLWTKYLALAFGTTMPAISIVAATFMGGLALGSFLVGRRADEESNLLRLYAWLEIIIALCAAASPIGLDLLTVTHTAAERLLPTHPLISHFIHFAFGAVLLIPPTVCMGGTFPLMCRFFARRKSGGQIGRLYAFNTFGATLGAFSAGYLLIPNMGLTATLYLAVAGNLMIAAAAWKFSTVPGLSGGRDISAATRPLQPVRAREHLVPLAAIAMIGFLSLAYEILWTRVLLLFLGNTTFAFSMILSVFLVGLAIGGAIYARKVRPDLDEAKVLIQLTLLMAIAVLVTVPFYDRLAEAFLLIHKISGEAWWLLTTLSFLLVFAVIGLPTIVSGSLLPATVALLDPGRIRTGQGVGLVVLANTAGAMFGSLIAGFAMVPLFGTQNSFLVLIALNLLVAIALTLRLRPQGWLRLAVPVAAVAGLAALPLISKWDQTLMNSGVYIYAPKYLQMGGLKETLERERILEVIEGEETTVAVHENLDGSMRFFSVNGKTDGGNGSDLATQLLVGHIPMLLHPRPDDVLVIGLGTGITLKGLTAYGSQQIDCVEISPEVVRAAAYFQADNGSALADPRINLLVEDGRNLLLTHPKTYDVIISEPSNPWQSGNANLFTADFYQLASDRLRPEGLFAQWIGLYDITPANLRIAINTLLSVFPEAMAFRAGSDLILIGAQKELKLDYRNIRQRLNNSIIGQTLATIGINNPGNLMASNYLFSEKSLRELAGGTRLNTDSWPVLEFSGHHLLGEKVLGAFMRDNQALLSAAAERVELPLTNLGANDNEIARALHEIADAYQKAGRTRASNSIRRTASELEASNSRPVEPSALRQGPT